MTLSPELIIRSTVTVLQGKWFNIKTWKIGQVDKEVENLFQLNIDNTVTLKQQKAGGMDKNGLNKVVY